MAVPANMCCPEGYVYVDSTGFYYSSCTGLMTEVLTWTDGPVSGTYNMCARTQCAPKAFGPVVSPSECPCCPDGYVYIQSLSLCVLGTISTFNTRVTTPSIPCIDCTCITPPPPTCPDTGNEGLPIAFNLNMSIKNCTSCTPQDNNFPPGCIQPFLPAQFLDPVTSTFVYKNKNYI